MKKVRLSTTITEARVVLWLGVCVDRVWVVESDQGCGWVSVALGEFAGLWVGFGSLGWFC